MSRTQVRNLTVPLIRAVSALRQTTSRLADTEPLVPAAVLELEDALAAFERIVYGKICAASRQLAFTEDVAFHETDLRR